ncbi:2-C-methyl-D-erythritol 4-phosphate cytidylyltransferase [Acinetobacter sp. WZC-1]|uniref:2-C-methyl-D-erythritol 4-phosphate cytidylyltransferase n=1 Tax=Acinetobacter sp. WZC-1 TaxID=3459034 RepID=UPI00403D732C
MTTILPLNSRKLWAIIPAAGSGNRFSQTALKQYQLIHGQTVLEHTVNRLNDLPLAGYVLAVAADDQLAATLDFKNKDRAHFCRGGVERVDSVLNALVYLSRIAAPDDLVLVHDAARPCVSLSCLEQLVTTAVSQSVSAILAVPVRDTLKRVAAEEMIETTISREQLWQAQTPQISTVARLKLAIDTALANYVVLTDEASALEYIGEPVRVVPGRADNIKITYPDDLVLARLILEMQQTV